MLRTEDHGRVRLLTLDRPQALNAFDNALYRATFAALREAGDDHDVACVVITGAGRAFSAGQDLGEMGEIDPDSSESHGFPELFDALSTFTKPLIAAVNGLGIGIGMTMLLHADLVIMADSARLRAPFTALGVVPEAASSLLLEAAIGRQAAAWTLYTSSWVSATEAQRWGLAWKVVPAEIVVDEAVAIGSEIATMATDSLVETKRLVLAARADAVAETNRREQRVFQRMIGGPANAEAISAFLEKREPDFSGLTPQG